MSRLTIFTIGCLMALSLVVGCAEEDTRFPVSELDLLLQGDIDTSQDGELRLIIDPERSLASINNSGEVHALPAWGSAVLEPVDCTTEGCPLVIRSLNLNIADGSIDDTTTQEIVATVTNIEGEFHEDNVFVLDRMTVALELSGQFDGQTRSAQLVPYDNIAGTIDLTSQVFTIFGSVR